MGLGLFWNRRPRSYIERTGDDEGGEQRRVGVVDDTIGSALVWEAVRTGVCWKCVAVVDGADSRASEGGILVVGAGGVVVVGRRGFDGEGDDVGQ